jgi:hypothetical protein
MSPGERAVQRMIRYARSFESANDLRATNARLLKERDEARAVARNYQDALVERKVRLPHNDITIERWDEQEYAEARKP